MLVDTMPSDVGPHVDGLEDAEITHAIPASRRNAADAKVFGPVLNIQSLLLASLDDASSTSFPALNYCFQQAGFTITLASDGSGSMTLKVVNSGGLVYASAAEKGPASKFLQRADRRGAPPSTRVAERTDGTRPVKGDLSNKYKEAVYGVSDPDWMPEAEQLAPYFAFEAKHKAASAHVDETSSAGVEGVMFWTRRYKAASKRLMTAATTADLSAAGCVVDGAAFGAGTFAAALEELNALASK